MRCWTPVATRPTSPSATTETSPTRILGPATAFAIAIVLTGCGLFRDGPGYDAIDLVDASYTADEERQVGLDFDRALRGQVRFIDDPVVLDFVETLGQSIVAQTGSQPYVYRFRVVEAPSLNAFAVFGGYIYLHSGTLLAASSIEEVAGVLGHEIAHVRMNHHARIHQKSKVPDLLARAAGLAGAVVTGSPEVLAGAMGINVALQLHFSRKLEAEADHHGTQYVAATGYDPAGVTRFFQRIVEAKRATPNSLPPYLYSHPEVEDRIGYVEAQAQQLQVAENRHPELASRLPDVQARLAQILDADRGSLLEAPAVAGNIIGPLLGAFERMRGEGRPQRALEMLQRAQRLEPNDPRIYYQRGELLTELGRHDEAAVAFRNTIELDPNRALPHYKLAEALEALGDREAAVRSYERAEFRAGANGALQKRAEWAVMRLTFDEWSHCRAPAASPANPAPDGAAADASSAENQRPCPGAE